MNRANKPRIVLSALTGTYLSLLGCGYASAQTDRPSLIVGKIHVADSGVDATRFDSDTLTVVFRFVLAADRRLQVGELTDASSGTLTSSSAYWLTSKLQSLRDSVFWTGELRLGGGNNPPVLLGPVVIADEKDLKAHALSEIAALIKRRIFQDAVIPRRTVSVYTCLDNTGSSLTRDIAEEFRVHLGPLLRRDDIIPVVPPPPCDGERPALTENTARVSGIVSERGGELSVAPTLEWQDYSIPLPTLMDDLEPALRAGEGYVSMLSRAIVAVFRRYSPSALGNFRQASTDRWQSKDPDSLSLESYPYLRVAILQRWNGDQKAETFYQLGRAFVDANEFAFAKSAFEKAIRWRPDWTDASRELGSALFELQRFDEAEGVLRSALERTKLNKDPQLQEKYAQVAHLAGKTSAAIVELDELIGSDRASASAFLLAGRIALDTRKLDAALQHMKKAFGLPGVSRKHAEGLARDLATVALDAPLPKQQLSIASDALDLIQGTDTQALLKKAYVRLRQGLAEVENPSLLPARRKKIVEAIEYYLQLMRASKADPELEVIELDIAEAYLFASSYEGGSAAKKDLQEAAHMAATFLTKKDERGLGLSSYGPVANFLITVGDYLLGNVRDPLPLLRSRIAAANERPSLFVNVPTGKGDTTKIRVTEWSFELFDAFVCNTPLLEKRATLRALSNEVQTKVNAQANPKPC